MAAPGQVRAGAATPAAQQTHCCTHYIFLFLSSSPRYKHGCYLVQSFTDAIIAYSAVRAHLRRCARGVCRWRCGGRGRGGVGPSPRSLPPARRLAPGEPPLLVAVLGAAAPDLDDAVGDAALAEVDAGLELLVAQAEGAVALLDELGAAARLQRERLAVAALVCGSAGRAQNRPTNRRRCPGRAASRAASSCCQGCGPRCPRRPRGWGTAGCQSQCAPYPRGAKRTHTVTASPAWAALLGPRLVGARHHCSPSGP